MPGSPFPLWSPCCSQHGFWGAKVTRREPGLLPECAEWVKGHVWAGRLARASGWPPCFTVPKSFLCVCLLNLLSLLFNYLTFLFHECTFFSDRSRKILIPVCLEVFSLHPTCFFQVAFHLCGFPARLSSDAWQAWFSAYISSGHEREFCLLRCSEWTHGGPGARDSG